MSPGDPRDPFPLQAEPAEGDERYLVSSARQVRALLRGLIEQRSLVSAHIGGRDQSFPSAVLAVDEAGLLLDGSPSETANRAIAEAGHLLCFAQLDRVRIRFRLEAVERIAHEGHVAFRAPVPEALYYQQRREYYRLETPLTDSPTCVIALADCDEDGEPLEPQPLRLRVLDISGGGMAVILPAGTPLLEVGAIYPQCELHLPEHAPIVLSLVVCSQFRQFLPGGAESFRAGLRFEALPRGADETIQRYIFRIERQRNARKSGLF